MPQQYTIIFSVLAGFVPSVLALLAYIIRIERALSAIRTDIVWIKETIS